MLSITLPSVHIHIPIINRSWNQDTSNEFDTNSTSIFISSTVSLLLVVVEVLTTPISSAWHISRHSGHCILPALLKWCGWRWCCANWLQHSVHKQWPHVITAHCVWVDMTTTTIETFSDSLHIPMAWHILDTDQYFLPLYLIPNME